MKKTILQITHVSGSVEELPVHSYDIDECYLPDLLECLTICIEDDGPIKKIDLLRRGD